MSLRLLIFLSLIMVSCRTIKTNYGKEREHFNTTVIDKKTGQNDLPAKPAQVEQQKTNTLDFTPETKTDNPSLVTDASRQEQNHNDRFTSKVPQSNQSDDDEISDEEKLDQAYWAESQAVSSIVFGSLSIVASIFLPPIGILLFIPALIFYIRANRSRFITEKGERHLSAAKIILMIASFILILWLGIIAIFIFL